MRTARTKVIGHPALKISEKPAIRQLSHPFGIRDLASGSALAFVLGTPTGNDLSWIVPILAAKAKASPGV